MGLYCSHSLVGIMNEPEGGHPETMNTKAYVSFRFVLEHFMCRKNLMWILDRHRLDIEIVRRWATCERGISVGGRLSCDSRCAVN